MPKIKVQWRYPVEHHNYSTSDQEELEVQSNFETSVGVAYPEDGKEMVFKLRKAKIGYEFGLEITLVPSELVIRTCVACRQKKRKREDGGGKKKKRERER